MTTSLARGERALAVHHGLAAGARVRRVEAHWEDGLVWTLDTPEGTRWYRTRGDGVEELRVEDDPRVPLCAALATRFPGPAQVLSWRPGRRVVASVGEGRDRVVAKGYRRRRSLRAAEAHAGAVHACADTPFRVPALLDRDDELETLVFEAVDGVPLAFGPAGTERFFRIGDGLQRLHRRPPSADLPEHGRLDELEVIDRLRATVARHARLADGVDDLRERVARGLEHVPRGEAVTLHRDLHDGQLLVAGRSLVLLDFDLCARGEPELDLANLSAHLTLRSLQGVPDATRENVEAASEALIEGYADSQDGELGSRLRLYQAATFLRLALLYSIRPPWTGLSPTLLGLSSRCMDDVGA